MLSSQILRMIDVHVQWISRHGIELDVGRNAYTLNRHISRRQVLGDGELESSFFGSNIRKHKLNGSLTKRCLANHNSAVLVLQRTGDNFAGTCRTAIGKNNDGIVGFRAVPSSLLFFAPLVLAKR